MKKLYWKLTLAALLCILQGCKASSGGSNSIQLTPQTLAELVLTFAGGASFEFNPDDMQATAGAETGTIINYDSGGATNVTFVNDLNEEITFEWPGGFIGTYTYRRAGTEAATIEIAGVSGDTDNNPSILGFIDPSQGGEPAELVIIFSPTGAFIQVDEITFTFPTAYPTEEEPNTGKITVNYGNGSITTFEGAPVPRNYTLDKSTRPSRTTTGYLDGGLFSYGDDNIGGTEVEILFDATTTFPTTSELKERGTAAFTDKSSLVTVQANYEARQPLGTDDVVVTVEFVSSTDGTDPFAIFLLNQGNDVYTFNFPVETRGTFSTSSGNYTDVSFFYINAN